MTNQSKDKKTTRQQENSTLWCQGSFALLRCVYLFSKCEFLSGLRGSDHFCQEILSCVRPVHVPVSVDVLGHLNSDTRWLNFPRLLLPTQEAPPPITWLLFKLCAALSSVQPLDVPMPYICQVDVLGHLDLVKCWTFPGFCCPRKKPPHLSPGFS